LEVLHVSFLDGIRHSDLLERRLQVTAVNRQEGTVFCRVKRSLLSMVDLQELVWDQPLISLFEEGQVRLLHIAGIYQLETRGSELYEIR
jgi:hypothetical protein